MIGSKAILERRRASINLSRAVSVSFPVGYTYEQCSLPSRDFDSFSSVPSRVCVCVRVRELSKRGTFLPFSLDEYLIVAIITNI